MSERWVDTGPLPSPDPDLSRHAARDSLDGSEVERLRLAAHRDQPGHRADFLAAHRALPADPAVVPVLAVDDSGFVVRARAGRHTLADLPGRLDSERVLALAGWLGPAVLAAGRATAGELRPEDIALGADGVPRLAPSGVPRGERASRMPRHVAPEIVRGSPPDGRAGLYGLGVLLYRLATGSWPIEASTTSALLDGSAQAVPPSERVPALGPEVDAVLLGLLAVDPGLRAAALPPRSVAPRLPVPATSAATPLAAPRARRGVVTTREGPDAPRRALADAAPPRAAVIADIDTLEPGARRALALEAGVSAELLDRLAERGLPLPIVASPDVDTVKAGRDRLLARGLPVRLEPLRGTPPAWRRAGAVLAAIGVIGPLVGLFPLALCLPAAFAVLLIGRLSGGRTADRVRSALDLVAQHAGSPQGLVAAGLRRVAAELRAELDHADLPEPAHRDLDTSLSRIVGRLAELDRSEQAITDALSRLPEAWLSAELAEAEARGDTTTIALRREALAQHGQLMDRLQGIRAGYQRIRASLDGLRLSFARLGSEHGVEDGVAGLISQVHALESAADELVEDPPPPRPRPVGERA